MRIALLLAAILWTNASFAEVKAGELAPAFLEKDQAGKNHSLHSYKGKWVVLEWYNEGCPYAGKHYKSHNMQKLQSTYRAKGVVWLTVVSSAEGKQGYIPPTEAAAHMKKAKMNSSALLLDSDGSMGRAYDAKTTPHMFVINPEGKVVYVGAIDDNDSANPETIKTSKNYVSAALDAGLSKKHIAVDSTRPYGCSVKYD